MKICSAQGAFVGGKQIGRAESSVVFCTDSAGEIEIGAESGRRPSGLGLRLGREAQRAVGVIREACGSKANQGATPLEVKHEFSPDKIRVPTSQLAQPPARNW